MRATTAAPGAQAVSELNEAAGFNVTGTASISGPTGAPCSEITAAPHPRGGESQRSVRIATSSIDPRLAARVSAVVTTGWGLGSIARDECASVSTEAFGC